MGGLLVGFLTKNLTKSSLIYPAFTAELLVMGIVIVRYSISHFTSIVNETAYNLLVMASSLVLRTAMS